MTSSEPNPFKTSHTNDSQPWHYFKGKLKSLAGYELYFVDQRNVAVVDAQNFYINGRLAIARDLQHFFLMLPKSGWNEKFEIHSYVIPSYCDHKCADNLQFPGKRFWRAKYAWIGSMPDALDNIPRKVFLLPISYYTGYVKKVFENRILFGDSRNSVMVSTDCFYVKGHRATTYDMENVMNGTDSVIHAYICKLHILTFPGLKGPEPYLPTWPKGTYTADLWVAKFAWQGSMPIPVKEQAERYYIIRLNEWSFPGCFPWKVSSFGQNNQNQKDDQMEKCTNYPINDDQSQELVSLPIVPMEQKPGIMKGAVLIADHKQALMTSFADVIAFERENFYINGEKFRSQHSLSHFLLDNKVYLNAWVQPLNEPKCIFHINVPWYASCVWLGTPPDNLTIIQSQNISGHHTEGNLVETIPTSTSLRLTHFLGNLTNISYNYGIFKCRVNLKHTVNVTFKRRVVYIYGSKLSGHLLDGLDEFENGPWSMLAYPVAPERNMPSTLQYCAIAVWQYQHQNYMGMIPALISEAVDNIGLSLKNNSDPSAEVADHISGWIIWICAEFGIIKATQVKEEEPVYVYFKKSLLYIDGEVWNDGFSLHEISIHQKCKVLTKPVAKREVFGYPISMEASLVWFGVKPDNIPDDNTDVNTEKSSLEEQSMVQFAGEKENITSLTEVEPRDVLHAVHGVVVGMVVMTNQSQGLLVSSRNIVAFSSKNFYINGEKFRNKYDSLLNYFSGEQDNVRALVVPLQEAKLVLHCKVMCEAVCVWTGLEPAHFKSLDLAYNKKNLAKKTTDQEKLSLSSGFFYILGHITKITKSMGIMTSTTPKGFVKIAFWNKSIFVNGSRLPEESILWKERGFVLSDWSCLAYPVAPKEYHGNVVRYYAVAIWHSKDHHKIGSDLLQLVSSEALELDRLESDLANIRINGQKVVQSSLKSGTSKCTLNNNSIDLKLTKNVCVVSKDIIPSQPHYGKHVNGYVIKKFKDGGIAHWKSSQHCGLIYIEFFCTAIYVDLQPIKKKFKVDSLEDRSCNFYVKPVPHHTVCGVTVSLQATCGWIGKKPPIFPRPGTQELANMNLKGVHVTPFDTLPNDTQEIEDSSTDSENRISPPPPLIGVKQKSPSQLQEPWLQVKQETPPQFSPVIISTLDQFVTLPPLSHTLTPAAPSIISTEDIWGKRSEKFGRWRGTVTGVFQSVGQLEGEDGKQHYFSRENCLLYGVSLCNVELWHVLVQGDKVLYSTLDSKPGSGKVDKVWFGMINAGCNKAEILINEWCKKNLVPDGARDIILHQLELNGDVQS